MPDHNLDDLIIDTIEPKNSKTKSFLTIIALAIIVLIIAIILTKIILKKPNAEILAEENSTEMISPDLTLQAAIEEKVIQKPLIPTTEKIKPEVHLAPTIKPIVTSTKKVKDIDTSIQEETTRKEAAKKEADEAAKLHALQLKEQLEKEQRIKKEADKKAKALAIQKETARQEKVLAKKAVESKKVLNPYFIQVGSFSKTPSQQFLSIIKNSGFTYQITTPSPQGTKKLLIGPYTNKATAETALRKVKDRINKSAYIIRK